MIAPDKVVPKSLKEMLCDDPKDKDSIRSYELTLNYVKNYLFSRFDGRRAYALKQLNKHWNTRVDVETLEDQGIIYAYIRFNKVPECVLVAKFLKARPTFEELPDKEEMGRWYAEDC